MSGKPSRTRSVRCDICSRRIYYRPGRGEPAKTLNAHRARAHKNEGAR